MKPICACSKSRNNADKELAAAIERKDQDAVDKYSFQREQSKLFVNSLPDRNNMRIDREQTIVTRSQNDIICLLADCLNFQKVNFDTFHIGDTQW